MSEIVIRGPEELPLAMAYVATLGRAAKAELDCCMALMRLAEAYLLRIEEVMTA